MKFNTRAESLPCISILGYPKGTTLGALEGFGKARLSGLLASP